jgi:hypothetical protein
VAYDTPQSPGVPVGSDASRSPCRCARTVRRGFRPQQASDTAVVGTALSVPQWVYRHGGRRSARRPCTRCSPTRTIAQPRCSTSRAIPAARRPGALVRGWSGTPQRACAAGDRRRQDAREPAAPSPPCAPPSAAPPRPAQRRTWRLLGCGARLNQAALLLILSSHSTLKGWFVTP